MAQKLGIFGYFSLNLHNFCIISHQMIKKCAQKAYLVNCLLNCKKNQIWNSLIHHTDKNGYFGTFWRLLTTFGIENGSMITLLIFSCLNFAKTMCNVEVDITKLKITALYGHFSQFENFLVRYCRQKISILPFFNHIWTHLPGVNGNWLELFMTCTKICQGL